MSGFDWRLYLSVAGELHQGGGEARNRSAISRAYYAAFGIAVRRRHSDALKLAKGSGSHQREWRTYETASDAVRQQIGLDGQRLRTRRNHADYHARLPGPAREAKAAISLAQSIIARVDKL